MNEIDNVWLRILACAGQGFTTRTGLPLTYEIDGNYLLPSRAKRRIAKSEFGKALTLRPLLSPGQLSKEVQGPAYVFAILTDARICNTDAVT